MCLTQYSRWAYHVENTSFRQIHVLKQHLCLESAWIHRVSYLRTTISLCHYRRHCGSVLKKIYVEMLVILQVFTIENTRIFH